MPRTLERALGEFSFRCSLHCGRQLITGDSDYVQGCGVAELCGLLVFRSRLR